MKKLLFVMNPYAGMRRANRFLADILSLFNAHGYEVTVHMTAGPGDGARAVEAMAGHGDLVVCAGGDGTFNETVTGLLRSGVDVPVGYIPCGSTNDFANSLKLPTNVLQAAQAILDGDPVPYDVGRFGDRYFSYVASFGAFTKASYSTPQNVKNALGHVAYVLQGAKELFQIPKEHVAFETDNGSFEGDYIFGAISNSTSVGGILTLDPNVVDMQDGKFELMLIRPPKDAVELMGCIQALTGQRYDTPMLTFCSASRLTVTASPEMAWTLDGEKEEGHETVEVENLHRAIRLVQGGEAGMKNTTLCYITRGDQVLMLHRVKKENDLNHDKWIGIGGKCEEGESPEECLLREAWEETGLTLTDFRYCGLVTFVSDTWEGEYMHLFQAEGFTGELRTCDEGDLEWVDRAFLDQLPKWEGDQIFLDLMWKKVPFFSLKLSYTGETLTFAALNGQPLER